MGRFFIAEFIVLSGKVLQPEFTCEKQLNCHGLGERNDEFDALGAKGFDL
jgi:hypothetical protein